MDFYRCLFLFILFLAFYFLMKILKAINNFRIFKSQLTCFSHEIETE
jgi:hypothetical protein